MTCVLIITESEAPYACLTLPLQGTDLVVENRHFSRSHSHLIWGDPFRISRIAMNLIWQKKTVFGLSVCMWSNGDPIYSFRRFDTIPECARRTQRLGLRCMTCKQATLPRFKKPTILEYVPSDMLPLSFSRKMCVWTVTRSIGEITRTQRAQTSAERQFFPDPIGSWSGTDFRIRIMMRIVTKM